MTVALKRAQAVPVLVLLAVSISFILAKSARDSLFFQAGGIRDLPLAYIGVAALSIPAAMMALSLIRRVGLGRANVIVPVAVAAIQQAFWPALKPDSGPWLILFFVVVPVAYGILFSAAWLGAARPASALSSGERARYYALLGATPMVGGLIAGFTAQLLSGFEPRAVVLLSSAVLGVAAAIQGLALGRGVDADDADADRQAVSAPKRGRMPGVKQAAVVLGRPFVQRLAFLAAAGTFVGLIVEFQFYSVVSATVRDQAEMSALFASFYTYVSLGALLLQLLVTPALQQRIGVGGNLLALPLALAGAGGLAFIFPTAVWSGYGLRLTEGGVKSSVHRSSWEQVYLHLPHRERSTAKVLVDAMIVHMTEGATAVLFLTASRVSPTATGLAYDGLPAILLIAVAAWAWATLRLRQAMQASTAVGAEGGGARQALPADGCAATAMLGLEICRQELEGAPESRSTTKSRHCGNRSA